MKTTPTPIPGEHWGGYFTHPTLKADLLLWVKGQSDRGSVPKKSRKRQRQILANLFDHICCIVETKCGLWWRVYLPLRSTCKTKFKIVDFKAPDYAKITTLILSYI